MSGRSSLVVLALVLAAGPAGAAERLPVVPLEAAGLRRLCEVVRPDSQVHFTGDEVQRGKAREEHRRRRAAALEKFYAVTVPAGGFTFREYDVADQRLPIEARRGFVVSDAAELVIPPGEDDPPELVVTAAPPLAEQLVRLRVKNKLALRLTFKLDPGASGDPCGRGAARRARVGIDPLAFELLETGRAAALFRGELPGYQEAVYATVPVKGPRVRLAKPSITGNLPPADVSAGLHGLEAGLLPCYQRGLESNARLRGALVVGVKLEGGRVVQAHSEINSLGDDAVVGCVVERVKTQRFPKLKGGGRISVPIYFSAEDD
ncbi:MAG TPA: AgmX/PglI C-terminal domain-containing protein [Polyangia bacterium]|jgi:hypothetical protein